MMKNEKTYARKDVMQMLSISNDELTRAELCQLLGAEGKKIRCRRDGRFSFGAIMEYALRYGKKDAMNKVRRAAVCKSESAISFH